MKAIILAGGFGTRISEETHRIPKPMIEIGGKPILWHIMKLYENHGINDFIICCGYKGEEIKRYFSDYLKINGDFEVDLRNGTSTFLQDSRDPWNVKLIDTGLNTMTGGRLKRIEPFVDTSDFCLTYGDGVSDVDISKLIAFHKNHKKIATLTAVKPSGRFGILDLEGEKITDFSEKQDFEDKYINGGFFVLNERIFNYLGNDNTILERGPLEQLAKGGELMAYRHDGFWQCMDSVRDLNLLRDLWESGAPPWQV